MHYEHYSRESGEANLKGSIAAELANTPIVEQARAATDPMALVFGR